MFLVPDMDLVRVPLWRSRLGTSQVYCLSGLSLMRPAGSAVNCCSGNFHSPQADPNNHSSRSGLD